MKVRISMKEFYSLGGFANPALFRRPNARGCFTYFMIVDRA